MDSGQFAVPTTAAAIGSGGCQGGLVLCAPVANTLSIWIGVSGVTPSTGLELKPGSYLDFSGWPSPPTDISQIYAVCVTNLTGPRIAWLKQT